jgi:amidohydrolase
MLNFLFLKVGPKQDSMEKQLFDKLVNIWRQLHQHPELGFREFQTSALVQQTLSQLGIPFETVAVTGVLGTLKKGEGPVVVLRADMDALPIQEETGLPFHSVHNNVMHACGHDIHTTMLLGAAHLLQQKAFSGTVQLLFQPSEEGTANSPEKGKSGGQLVAESGLLQNASAVLGLHVHPLLPLGQLEYRNGEYLSNVGNFSIHITGVAGHAGSLEHVVDPVLVSAQLIVAAQSIISHAATAEPAVLAFTRTEVSGPPAFNIIPEKVLLQGSLRALHLDTYNRIVARLQDLLKGLETAFGCRIEMEFSAYYPSLVNDAGVHEKLSGARERVFGNSQVVEGKGLLIAEDFAFYSREIPAQFYFLGAQAEDVSECFYLHHPRVQFNENCIALGATFLAEGAVDLVHAC